MHIALIIEHFSPRTGGAEAFAVTVCQELQRRGHRISVAAADGDSLPGIPVTFGPLAEAPDRLAPLRPGLVIDWGLNAPAHLHRLGGGTHREFQRLVLESVPQPGRLLKRCLYALSPRHARVARRERELLCRPGTHVLAVSRFVADQVDRTVRLPGSRLHVLHNGVDTSRFAPDTSGTVRHTRRRAWGARADDVVFLTVGHNLVLKNFCLLQRVFATAHEGLPQARLVLLGKRNPGLQAPWFCYAGASDRPEDAYAAADVLLHPTFYDACANVVLEALGAGMAVVSSDRNGSAEVITHGRDGMVLPVVGRRQAVDAAWAEAIALLATDGERRRALGRAARELAETLSIQRYVDRFETLLRTIASAHETEADHA